jgi:hypothetical protein
MDQENILAFKSKPAPASLSRHYLVNNDSRSGEIVRELKHEIQTALKNIETRNNMIEIDFINKLRLDLLEKISSLKMPNDRKNYYCHQINLIHSLPELFELVQEMNEKQVKDHTSKESRFLNFSEFIDQESQGIISLVTSNDTIQWVQHSVTRL